MKPSRAFFAITTIISLVAIALVPTTAGAEQRSRFALSGEARALELALGDQGITLGMALSRADSKPSASGAAAGQCDLLGEDVTPDNLPCNESTTAVSEYPGTPGGLEENCAGPALPDPINTVIDLDLACGASLSKVARGLPTTVNNSKVGDLAIGLDVSGVIPQAEEAKDQLVDQLQGILDQAPDEIENALDQLLDAVDQGQGGRVLLGPASSDVTSAGNVVKVASKAAGARIGVVGIPDLDEEGVPIAGSANALEDGLIIVEVGTASASASVNKSNAESESAASAALVTVKVRDITKVQPTYVEVEVAPGQTVTILEGTPAESTIKAASAAQDQSPGSARAAADAVSVHLLKGVQGGVRLALGRAVAAATVRVADPAPPAQPETRPRTLPQTGANDLTLLGLGLVVAAIGALAVRRRFSR